VILSMLRALSQVATTADLLSSVLCFANYVLTVSDKQDMDAFDTTHVLV
jgi:hypothetical protein